MGVATTEGSVIRFSEALGQLASLVGSKEEWE